MSVTVFRDRKARGWPGTERVRDHEYGYVVSLSKALTHRYTTDAHFVQYASPNRRRLNTGALDLGLYIEMTTIALDVDYPKDGTPVTEWRESERGKMSGLGLVHPDPFYYETKNGYRIIYRQPFSVSITDRYDSASWRRDYLTTCNYLERVFGVKCDRACSDWTRFFRLPLALRDGKHPESMLTYGDPGNVGVLLFTPSKDDVPVDEVKSRPIFCPTSCSGMGRGVLYELMRQRGYILGTRKNGYIVKCPNDALHSSGSPGDGSTMLYSSDKPTGLGAIHCLHSHCRELKSKDWLSLLQNGRERDD